MLGLPIELEIEGNNERIFFATRRRGQDGEDMRKHRRAFHTAKMAALTHLRRVEALEIKADQIPADTQDRDLRISEILGEQGKELQASLDAKEQAREACERLVRLSLGENYPDTEKVERILGSLTDNQLAYLVTVLETGEVPADFFPRRATLPKPSTTTQPGDGAGASS